MLDLQPGPAIVGNWPGTAWNETRDIVESRVRVKEGRRKTGATLCMSLRSADSVVWYAWIAGRDAFRLALPLRPPAMPFHCDSIPMTFVRNIPTTRNIDEAPRNITARITIRAPLHSARSAQPVTGDPTDARRWGLRRSRDSVRCPGSIFARVWPPRPPGRLVGR